MTTTHAQTVVQGAEEVTQTYQKRTGYFLFFKTEWWELVSTEHIGNDINIRTTRPIRAVYLNDQLLTPSPEEPN